MKKLTLFLMALLMTTIAFAVTETVVTNLGNASMLNMYGEFVSDGTTIYYSGVWNESIHYGNFVGVYDIDTLTYTMVSVPALATYNGQRGGYYRQDCRYRTTDDTIYCAYRLDKNGISVDGFGMYTFDETGNQIELSNYTGSGLIGNGNVCDLNDAETEFWCATDGTDTMEIYKYIIGTDTWSYIGSFADVGANAVSVCEFRPTTDELWCIANAYNNDNIFIYDTSTNTSSTSKSLNTLSGGDVLLHCRWYSDVMYCYSGDDGSYPIDEIYYYDATGDTTGTLTATLPNTLEGNCFRFDSDIDYCINGFTGTGWGDSYEVYELNWNPCIPDWTCSGYSGECVDSEYACDEVVDNNDCGESYTGNYTEFEPQTCTLSQYEPSHGITDVTGLVIDFGVEFGMQAIALAGIIALIGIAVWIRGRLR